MTMKAFEGQEHAGRETASSRMEVSCQREFTLFQKDKA